MLKAWQQCLRIFGRVRKIENTFSSQEWCSKGVWLWFTKLSWFDLFQLLDRVHQVVQCCCLLLYIFKAKSRTRWIYQFCSVLKQLVLFCAHLPLTRESVTNPLEEVTFSKCGHFFSFTQTFPVLLSEWRLTINWMRSAGWGLRQLSFNCIISVVALTLWRLSTTEIKSLAYTVERKRGERWL